MTNPFIGELKVVSFGFPPKGWAFCNGQLLPINQNQALFSLLGTTYGGDGRTTFALPDLRRRSPVHNGQRTGGTSFTLGTAGGEAAHTLSVAEMPAHRHQIASYSGVATTVPPAGKLVATSANPAYGTLSNAQMATDSVGATGGGQPHSNMPPYLVLNYIIALQGVFPSRN